MTYLESRVKKINKYIDYIREQLRLFPIECVIEPTLVRLEQFIKTMPNISYNDLLGPLDYMLDIWFDSDHLECIKNTLIHINNAIDKHSTVTQTTLTESQQNKEIDTNTILKNQLKIITEENIKLKEELSRNADVFNIIKSLEEERNYLKIQIQKLDEKVKANEKAALSLEAVRYLFKETIIIN